MPYQKSISKNETKFEVIPEDTPSIFMTVLPLIILPILLLFAVNTTIGLISTIGVGVWLYFIQNNKLITLHRKPTTFFASPEGVKFNGNTFKKEDIHRVIIRNNMDNSYVLVTNRDMYNNPAATIQGLKLREKVIKVSYRVDIESGGRPITIAGGITEPTAFAISKDIHNIVDL